MRWVNNFKQVYIIVRSCRNYTSRVSPTLEEEELKQARQWLTNFDIKTIPKDIFHFSFSRSSGPGGQNVNKVNSKATLKVSISSLKPIMPPILLTSLIKSRYHTDRSDELVIQSDNHRKQQDNVTSCLDKLRDLMVEVGKQVIPGETSDDQKKHVKQLQKINNEHRLKEKKMHSQKKSSRRNSSTGE